MNDLLEIIDNCFDMETVNALPNYRKDVLRKEDFLLAKKDLQDELKSSEVFHRFNDNQKEIKFLRGMVQVNTEGLTSAAKRANMLEKANEEMSETNEELKSLIKSIRLLREIKNQKENDDSIKLNQRYDLSRLFNLEKCNHEGLFFIYHHKNDDKVDCMCALCGNKQVMDRNDLRLKNVIKLNIYDPELVKYYQEKYAYIIKKYGIKKADTYLASLFINDNVKQKTR